MSRQTDQKVYDPSVELIEAVGDECETALTNEGVSEASTKVWQPVVPNDYDVGFPRIVYHVNVARAPGWANQESRSVEATATVKTYDTDPNRLITLKVRVMERLTDRNNFPALSGWNTFWQDLTNDTQTNERTEGMNDVYGRLQTIEYYMARS